MLARIASDPAISLSVAMNLELRKRVTRGMHREILYQENYTQGCGFNEYHYKL